MKQLTWESIKRKSSDADTPIINLRGDVVPIYQLNSFFHQNRLERHTNTNHHPAIVVKQGLSKIAFEVDQIIGQQQVVIRPLNDQLESLSEFFRLHSSI